MGKKLEELKNYRLKYKRYYNIEFSGSYDIHHIDFDRKNNDISNLLLLPKELHAKYHLLINELGGVDKCGNIHCSVYINLCVSNFNAPILEQLGAVLQDINKWVIYKQQLDLQKQIKQTRF